MANSETKSAHPPIMEGPALTIMLAQSARMAALNTSEKTLIDPNWESFQTMLKDRLLAASKHFGYSGLKAEHLSFSIRPHNPTHGHRVVVGDYEDKVTITVRVTRPHHLDDQSTFERSQTESTCILRETLARADGMAMVQTGRKEATSLEGPAKYLEHPSTNSVEVSLKAFTEMLNAVPCEHPLLDLPEAPFCSVYTHIGNPERLGR